MQSVYFITKILILSLTTCQLLLLIHPSVAADVPNTEECLQDGIFCFEVLRGPRYSYRIRQDDELVLFSLFARRDVKNGEYASHSWNISFSDTIDDGHATLSFIQADKPFPALRFDVLRSEKGEPTLRLYQYKENSEDHWELIGKRLKADYFKNYERADHSIKFTTTDKVDQLLGLENMNLTIGFSLKTEVVNGETSKEVIDFTTTDGHYFFKDKPEIREFREKRRIAKQKEAARTNMTIIIISVVVGLIVISAVVFAIFKFRK